MARRIIGGLLVTLSALFLALSIIGMGAIWFYKGRATSEVTSRLQEIDGELAQAEVTLKSSEQELQRALRIVNAAQTALEKLTQQSQSAENLFDSIHSTLDDRLLPELKTTRGRIDQARATLENLQSVLNGVSGFIPGVDLNVPQKLLTDLITSARSLDTEIANVQTLATQASTFVSDTSFLLGGDLTETRDSLQNFLAAIQDYEKKVADWRAEDQRLLEGTPQWITQASILLTIFLFWFGLSQFGLLLHGFSILRGNDPLEAIRREPPSLIERVKEETDESDAEEGETTDNLT